MKKIDRKKVLLSLESPLGEPPANVWARCGNFPVEIVAKTGSTNDDLKEAARNGSACRALIAEKQTAGKGRQGRSFFSEGGVYLSAILPPLGEAAPFVTHIAAVAVAEALRALTGENAEIKWVNDVYVDGKKVCGILCESVVTEKGRAYVAGIGVNTSEPKGGFPSEIAETAGAVPCDRSALAGEILKRLFYHIVCFDRKNLQKSYTELCFLQGKEVVVVQNESERPATVLGLTEDLGLTVRYTDGSKEDLRSGEVRLRLRRADGDL